MSLREWTSWSCRHGVLRWSGEYGCIPGDGVWKPYLPSAFERLAQAIDRAYEGAVRPFLDRPWTLRDRNIQVMLGESSEADVIYRMQRLLDGSAARAPAHDSLLRMVFR